MSMTSTLAVGVTDSHIEQPSELIYAVAAAITHPPPTLIDAMGCCVCVFLSFSKYKPIWLEGNKLDDSSNDFSIPQGSRSCTPSTEASFCIMYKGFLHESISDL